MPIAVRVDTSGFDRRSRRVRAVFASPRTAQELTDYLRGYHVRFRMKWQGSRYMAGPRSNLFWQTIVAGWQDPEVSGSRMIFRNTSLLNWKITGGTIVPQAAQKLTIPLIPEAKGLRAAEFVNEEQTPLFRVGHALMRRIGAQLQAVYALVDSVEQAPWPEALPSHDQLADAWKRSVNLQVQEINRS